jgi:flagellar biosynthesis/type III secretory pathway chaperone
MSETRLNEQKLYYQMVITVWEGFCELHRDLYDLACEEYLTLLASDIDKLETMLPRKEEIIAKVSILEKERADLIAKINATNVFDIKIERVNDLLLAFDAIDSKASIPALRNLNALLIDIIQKIQEQNKKNQIFLNKAMISLREIKQGFTGKKTYTTYGADGMTRAIGR